MTWKNKAVLYAGSLAFIALVWQARLAAEREEALRDARIEQLQGRADSLTRVSDSLLKAFHKDTVRLTKWRTKWDTLKAKVDTQWLEPDSVPVPVEVVRTVVVTADSTIRACALAVADCGKARATAETRAVALEVALAQAVKPDPLVKRVLNRLAWVGVGVVVGQVSRPP